MCKEQLSHTEISLRVKGIIADVFSVGCDQVVSDMYLRYVGVKPDASPRPAVHVEVIVDRVERSFDLRIEEAHTNVFREIGTVGELISLVEGALSPGGIA